jgi:hypothetical protein
MTVATRAPIAEDERLRTAVSAQEMVRQNASRVAAINIYMIYSLYSLAANEDQLVKINS